MKSIKLIKVLMCDDRLPTVNNGNISYENIQRDLLEQENKCETKGAWMKNGGSFLDEVSRFSAFHGSGSIPLLFIFPIKLAYRTQSSRKVFTPLLDPLR